MNACLPARLVIFDLDGTLADSFPWFLRNVNSVADRFGFHPIAEDDIEALRRAGPREILQRLNVPPWKLPMIARHMRRLKAAHLDDIPLFPGVDRLLQALAAKGIATGIVSSDNENNVRRTLGPSNARLIAHYSCGASLFGKAARFKRVLRMAGVPAEQALSIGDEIRDLEAAHKAGVAFGAVSWGYACPEALQACAPDEMFSSMDDIVRCFGGVATSKGCTMTDDATELTTWTLGSVKASGMVLEGGCATAGCNEFARFDIDGLISRFGADWCVPKILPVRCQTCGAWLHFQLAVLHDNKPGQ